MVVMMTVAAAAVAMSAPEAVPAAAVAIGAAGVRLGSAGILATFARQRRRRSGHLQRLSLWGRAQRRLVTLRSPRAWAARRWSAVVRFARDARPGHSPGRSRCGPRCSACVAESQERLYM